METRLYLLCLVVGALPAFGAETGDLDGDGRLSIADAIHAVTGLDAAPGSLDALLTQDPCGTTHTQSYYLAGILYTASLSRNVEGSLPHWIPVLNDPAAPRQAPLAADPRVAVRIGRARAPGGGDDAAELDVTLTSSAPVRAFSLVLDSDGGALRLPFDLDRFVSWSSPDFDRPPLQNSARPFGGDLTLGITPATTLITGGRYVVSYNLRDRQAVVLPGEHRLRLDVRLPRGLRTGEYAVWLVSGSEVLLDDGTLVAPTNEANGVLEVEADVTAGWDEGAPPLRIDPVERRVLGKVELRVTGAEGYPGDEVKVRVQVRTETTLNWLAYMLFWPDARLTCVPGPDGLTDVPSIWVNPEDGETYREHRSYCYDRGQWGRYFHEGSLYLAGVSVGGNGGHDDRPLEHFKPLGEWVDVTELTLRIAATAEGGTEIPLAFQPYDPNWTFFWMPEPAQFAPYLHTEKCNEVTDPPWPQRWKYDIAYHDAAVRVLGDGDPVEPQPVDAGIRLLLGSTSGRPGELLEVPLFAASREPLGKLQLVLATDPGAAIVEAIDVEVLDLKSLELVRRVLSRGGSYIHEVCGPGGRPAGDCTHGIPWIATFHETGESFAHIDILPSTIDRVVTDYPGPEPREIARLHVRIPAGATAAETIVAFGKMARDTGAFEVKLESGGDLLLPPPGAPGFAPASETRPAVITILGNGFRRGDANADERADLSDAVSTLQYLFSGGSVACLDAADADDSGVVEITDAVFLLGALFLGTRPIPAPYPECGADAAGDGLGCKAGCDAS